MEEIFKGTSTFLVKDDDLKKGFDSAFVKYLEFYNFSTWGKKGNYGCEWIFVNLNSKKYALGVPGVEITKPIGSHAITINEFKTIFNIYKKYDINKPLDMRNKCDIVIEELDNRLIKNGLKSSKLVNKDNSVLIYSKRQNKLL